GPAKPRKPVALFAPDRLDPRDLRGGAAGADPKRRPRDPDRGRAERDRPRAVSGAVRPAGRAAPAGSRRGRPPDTSDRRVGAAQVPDRSPPRRGGRAGATPGPPLLDRRGRTPPSRARGGAPGPEARGGGPPSGRGDGGGSAPSRPMPPPGGPGRPI